MSYLSIRQCRVGDIESVVFNESVRQQAIKSAVDRIWSYHEQALLIGTEADQLAYNAPNESSRAMYRAAYLCVSESIRILDAFYGMIPSGKVPYMEDLVSAATYYAELSGSTPIQETAVQ